MILSGKRTKVPAVAAMTAVLLGGPRDGFEDRVLPPFPELVTVQYCPDCRREHTVEIVAGWPADDEGPVYLRVDDDPPPGAGVVYRWTEDLVNAVVAHARRFEATQDKIAAAVAYYGGRDPAPPPPAPGCRCVLTPAR